MQTARGRWSHTHPDHASAGKEPGRQGAGGGGGGKRTVGGADGRNKQHPHETNKQMEEPH